MEKTRFLLLLVLSVGCSTGAGPDKGAPDLTSEDLLNAEYQLPSPGDPRVHVVNGRWEFENDLGKQSLYVWDEGLRSDVDGDGLEDALLFYEYWGGGSGVFKHMALVGNSNGRPLHIASEELGDRVKIDSFTLHGNLVTLELVVHDEDDGLCCPTLRVRTKYRIQGHDFLRVGSETIGHIPDEVHSREPS